MEIMDIQTNPKFLDFIPEEQKKLMTALYTSLRLMREITEYGGVRMSQDFFDGLLAYQIAKEFAVVMESTSKMLYVLRASLGTIGGFIKVVKKDGVCRLEVLL